MKNDQAINGAHKARRRWGAASTIAILAVLAASSVPAAAQTENKDKDKEGDPVAEAIIITGSRIVRDGFQAPNPVTVVGAEQMKDLGLHSASDVLAQLPQNSNFVSEANVGQGNFNIGSQLANLRGLNPFFGTRTLTLINGKRHVATTNGGAVDLGVIPSILIQRVETVTGGASAAYGSDAIAGVTNIILDNRLEGLKGDINFGQNFAGDGASYSGSLAFGTSFSGGRGHFIIGGEYNKDEPMGACGLIRSWCGEGWGLYANDGYAGGNGAPHNLFGPDARSFTSSNGLFPNLLTTFNNGGTATRPFVAGKYSGIFNQTMQGGDSTAPSPYDTLTMRPDVERYTAFGRLEYEFSNSVTAYVEGNYHHRTAQNIQSNSGASPFSNLIYNDNFYLPAGDPVQAALPGYPFFGPAFISTGAFTSDGAVLPNIINNTKIDVYRGAVGLEGKISSSWGWDAYYTYGRTNSTERVSNFKVLSFFNWALDAVDNPSSPGTPICRATLQGVPGSEGCVPLNLFGNGNYSQAAIDYSYRTLHQDTVNQQHVISASLHGDLFDGWGAGPIKTAFGAEYRKDSIDVAHDTANQPWYNFYERTYGSDYAATTDVLEGFAELSVPVVKDVPFFQSVLIDGALRGTHNKLTNDLASTSASHEFITWKISGVWDVNDWLRFRATRSRDVRAPSFYESFAVIELAPGALGPPLNNPWAGGAPQSPFTTLQGSDGNLAPEKANTWTIGAVLTGQGALRGFRASLDWYEVNLKDAISVLPVASQQILDFCHDLAAYCQYIQGTGPVPGTGGGGSGYANITRMLIPYVNVGRYITRGFDGEVSYFLPLKGDSSLTSRALGTYLYDLIIDQGLPGVPVDNFAGISGPTRAFGYFNTSPKFQGNAFVTYASGPFRGTVQARYIGAGKFHLRDDLAFGGGNQFLLDPSDAGYSPTASNSISNNRVDPAVYINLSTSYRIPLGQNDKRSMEIFGSINNLFGKNSPVAPGGNGYPTNPVFFDTYGAAFKVGARFSY